MRKWFTLFVLIVAGAMFLATGCEEKKEEKKEEAKKEQPADENKDETPKTDEAPKDEAPKADLPAPGPVTKKAIEDAALAVKDLKVSWITPEFAMTPGDQLEVAFKVEAAGEVAKGVFDVKASCKSGDDVLTTYLDPQVDLRNDASGLPAEESIKTFKGTPADAHLAPCELEFIHFPLLPDVPMTDYRNGKVFARHCFDGTAVAEGECADIKKTSVAEAIKIRDVKGSFEKDDLDENMNVVVVHYVADVGVGALAKSPQPAMDGLSTKLALSCDVNGAKTEGTAVGFGPGSEMLTIMDPGDTVKLRAKAFAMDGIPAEPSKCDVTIKENSMMGDGDTLGTYCIEKDKVTEGACK